MAVAVGMLLAFGLSPAAAGAARPNVVVIMTDDQDLRSVSVMPRVRGLIGAAGTTFTNSFASFPACCPSRATFLTGQYARNHGVLTNVGPLGGFYRLRGAETLPVWLRRAGYATVMIGKYLNGYGTRDPRQVPPGWSDWHGLVDRSTYHYYGYTLNSNGRLSRRGRAPADYQTDVLARMAASAVTRRAASPQPFLLWLNFLAPHTIDPEGGRSRGVRAPVPAPRHRGRFRGARLPTPPSFNEADVSDKPHEIRGEDRLDTATIDQVRDAHRARLESLLAVDEAVGRVMAALRASGELANTLVVFTSDNGYLQGEHRIPEGKTLHYEPATRVPLMVRGPGFPAAARRGQLVANIDLAPTIAQAAGAQAALAGDGRALQALAASPSLDLRRDLLLENGPEKNAESSYTGLRSTRWKYVEWRNGDRELYDLAADPFELSSQHANPALAALRAHLAARLARLRSCRGPACSAPAY